MNLGRSGMATHASECGTRNRSWAGNQVAISADVLAARCADASRRRGWSAAVNGGSRLSGGYDAEVSIDQSLFPNDEPSSFSSDSGGAALDVPSADSPSAAPNWQIDMIRRALDAQELRSMADRQAAVESAVGRPVTSLRDLTADEARSLLHTLAESRQRTSASTPAASSSWDDRDHDTWIDRL